MKVWQPRASISQICNRLSNYWNSFGPLTRYLTMVVALAAVFLLLAICIAPHGKSGPAAQLPNPAVTTDSQSGANGAVIEHFPPDPPAETLQAKPGGEQAATKPPTAARDASTDPTNPSPRTDLAAALDYIARAENERSHPTPAAPAAEPPVPENSRPAAAPSPPKIASDPKRDAKFAAGGGLEGRQGENKYRLVLRGGASPASEEAIVRGLNWLVAHQRDDGSWHFQFDESPCNDRCRNPGSVPSTTASTGFALLAFLGAGYTHENPSDYKDVVAKGLYYLGSRLLKTPQGGDLQEGTLYSQAIATIALCEAYAMTGDKALKPFCQSAVDFILYAQDKKGGGWRYFPGQPGDTTSFGWHLMALKSATLAGLDVPAEVIYMCSKFLDSVETDGGAGYGYLGPKREATTTAIGLLCRMYTGWGRDHPGMKPGIEYLAKLGPSQDNLYFNYYATQCLHKWDGEPWNTWNYKIREHLIATQAKDGHEAGSWYFAGGQAKSGGRLYTTAMAIMTLEVYYRYLPLNIYKPLEDDPR